MDYRSKKNWILCSTIDGYKEVMEVEFSVAEGAYDVDMGISTYRGKGYSVL